MAKTVVIYSLKNEESVRKVNAWKQKYPKFSFVTVDDTEAIKAAKKEANIGTVVMEFDAPAKANAKPKAKPKAKAKAKPKAKAKAKAKKEAPAKPKAKRGRPKKKK